MATASCLDREDLELKAIFDPTTEKVEVSWLRPRDIPRFLIEVSSDYNHEDVVGNYIVSGEDKHLVVYAELPLNKQRSFSYTYYFRIRSVESSTWIGRISYRVQMKGFFPYDLPQNTDINSVYVYRDNTVYTLGEDYVISNGKISRTPVSSIPDGQNVTISYLPIVRLDIPKSNYIDTVDRVYTSIPSFMYDTSSRASNIFKLLSAYGVPLADINEFRDKLMSSRNIEKTTSDLLYIYDSLGISKLMTPNTLRFSLKTLIEAFSKGDYIEGLKLAIEAITGTVPSIDRIRDVTRFWTVYPNGTDYRDKVNWFVEKNLEEDDYKRKVQVDSQYYRQICYRATIQNPVITRTLSRNFDMSIKLSDLPIREVSSIVNSDTGQEISVSKYSVNLTTSTITFNEDFGCNLYIVYRVYVKEYIQKLIERIIPTGVRVYIDWTYEDGLMVEGYLWRLKPDEGYYVQTLAGDWITFREGI